ncbi:SGNH/GDSL hydrolase family protein [Nocardia neocaledoniensis]|uniref:SGNH/GDSL hydrolase family protein n=1 Tax=Nocardia neocaledoniensis TaxID=236511 RepID=UPI002457AAF0|nr:SGNH/GDSL hydrolase family protein [Nocardia neocaledoniensis]
MRHPFSTAAGPSGFDAPSARFSRYVALGDSQTEGVGDGDDSTGVIGLADRLAETMARTCPGLLYANLAVRGKLAGQVREEQLEAALTLRPDVATVIAGVNDLLRPRFDPASVGAQLDAMFAALTGQDAVVATVTVPDLSRVIPVARPLSGRIAALNEVICQQAERHGVLVARVGDHPVATDPRLWARDRLHCGPLGHQRIAEALAEVLGLPGSDSAWATELPTRTPAPGPMNAVATEWRWARGFLGPWLLRRLTGRSSGDGRVAKRPQLTPVVPAEAAPVP